MATGTTKKKAVHSIRLLKTPAKDGKPAEFQEIKPNTIFDCPNDKIKELEDAGAILPAKKMTPDEVRAAAAVEDDVNGDGDDSGDGQGATGDGEGGTDGDDTAAKAAVAEASKKPAATATKANTAPSAKVTTTGKTTSGSKSGKAAKDADDFL